MILPTGFGPIADVWRDNYDFVDFVHFKKWIILALGSCKRLLASKHNYLEDGRTVLGK